MVFFRLLKASYFSLSNFKISLYYISIITYSISLNSSLTKRVTARLGVILESARLKRLLLNLSLRISDDLVYLREVSRVERI